MIPDSFETRADAKLRELESKFDGVRALVNSRKWRTVALCVSLGVNVALVLAVASLAFGSG